MAGGPIYATSEYHADTTGRTWRGFYAGGGGNASAHDEAIQVKTSLDADATVELRFPIPPTPPSGALKMRALFLANATSGTIKYTIKDKNVAAGASPSAATLTSETQDSLTWASGDADKYKEVKTVLTSSPAGNDVLVVAITFNTTSWTLAQVLSALFAIIWE